MHKGEGGVDISTNCADLSDKLVINMTNVGSFSHAPLLSSHQAGVVECTCSDGFQLTPDGCVYSGTMCDVANGGCPRHSSCSLEDSGRLKEHGIHRFENDPTPESYLCPHTCS